MQAPGIEPGTLATITDSHIYYVITYSPSRMRSRRYTTRSELRRLLYTDFGWDVYFFVRLCLGTIHKRRLPNFLFFGVPSLPLSPHVSYGSKTPLGRRLLKPTPPSPNFYMKLFLLVTLSWFWWIPLKISDNICFQ